MSKECEKGCTCNKHKAHYRGGSKKGRKFSPEARQRIADAARNRKYTAEAKQKLSEQMKAHHADPEWEAKRIAALKEAGTACDPDCECGRHAEEKRRKVSEARAGVPLTEEWKRNIGKASRKHWARKTPEERSQIAWERIKKYGVAKVSGAEYALAPYLAKLGYTHNDDRALVVGRRFPDFYNQENKRLFEYFGNYWHPRPEEAEEVVDYYRLLGWECEVLWEADFHKWVDEHEGLLGE